MTDDDRQHSGSRWETAPGCGGPGFAAAPSVPVESGPYAATATALPAAGRADGTPARSGPAGKGLTTAVAAGFLVIRGVGTGTAPGGQGSTTGGGNDDGPTT